MTTNKLTYENNFFFFDEKKVGKRVINPRNNTNVKIKFSNDPNQKEQRLISNYDLEIFHLADPADVFCNIKTTMTWDFEINKPTDLGSIQFAETLMHNILNQVHFATTILRQNFIMDFVTIADLVQKPNPKNIFKQLKEKTNFLADLNLNDSYPFLFSYWYR